MARATLAQAAVPDALLPIPATPLLGRAAELSSGCQLLQQQGVRLVTLTGPGGTGKTRLALQIATELNHLFVNGTFWISLAALSDATLVIPMIAQSLGLKDHGERPLLTKLKEVLQQQTVLLLLDNFEQVIAAAPQLAELLAGCASLKLLVTSRARLHIRDEYEFPVPPLSLPSSIRPGAPTASPSLPAGGTAELAQYAAIALFVERARAVKPDFRLTDDNAAAVSTICTRLDGLPLAIELAAAWIKLLSPQAMLSHLAHPMQWLTSGARDMPYRQQALRHTLQWSYDLLEPEEKRLFRCLGLFVNGCSLPAAESVWMAADTPLFSLLAALVDKNLLRQVSQSDGEPRLFMLETIRTYALEQLARHGEAEAAEQAHQTYFLTLAAQAEPQLTGPDQTLWISRLDRELDNIRAVLQNSLERGDGETAVQLGSCLWRFWYLRGYLGEGRRWLEAALASSDNVSLPLRVKAFSGAAFLAAHLSDYPQARAWGQKALTLAQTWGDKPAIAAALASLATTSIWQGHEESLKLYSQALALYQELNDATGISMTTTYLAFAHWFRGDYSQARQLFDEALIALRQAGNQSGTAFALYGLGFVALNQGDDKAAFRRYSEALTIMQGMGDKRGLIRAYYGLGRVALNQGNFAQARMNLVQSCALSAEVGEQWSMAAGLEGLAGLAAMTGKPTLAAHLLGTAEALWSRIGASMPPALRFWVDRDAALVRKALNGADFSLAYEAGRSWTADQAITQVVAQFAPTLSSGPSYGLTPREQEVLRLLAAGLTDPQIAEQLVIGVRTAQSHVRAILSKLGVNSRTAAARYALEQGLV
jgi:predicted ATPase/DNA-binding CsgD family transcriptional regulator